MLNFKTLSADLRRDLMIEKLLRESLFPEVDKSLNPETAYEQIDTVYDPKKKHAIHDVDS